MSLLAWVGINLEVRAVTTVFLAMLLPMVAPAGETAEPSAIAISQPLQVQSTATMQVHISVYNRTDFPQPYEGDVADENGRLILSGGWDIILEEIKEGKILSSRSLSTGEKHVGVRYTLEPQGHRQWDWNVSGSELTDHPGNYRFQLKYGNLATTGELLRVVDTLKTPEHIQVKYAADKEGYFIGEPITVRFTIKNHGKDVFLFEKGGDYRGATRYLRFYFTAANEKAEQALDPRP